jgi:hypothetical protein
MSLNCCVMMLLVASALPPFDLATPFVAAAMLPLLSNSPHVVLFLDEIIFVRLKQRYGCKTIPC